MFSPVGFSIQEFFLCYFYCQKTAIVCVGMRFCEHVPNSPRKKNPKKHNPYLLEKVVFLDLKRLLSSLGRGKKKNFFNFEFYDLTNGKEQECKIW
jgi:hypothetical protein